MEVKMVTIDEILKSRKKPKEIVTLLAQKLMSDKGLVVNLIRCFENGSVTEKGNCIEAIEYITKEDPEFAKNYLDFIIDQINDKAPRVKWETARIIGNTAQKFPDKVKEAVPMLLENIKDKSTVVRWSAAFALTEIAKSNPKLQKELTTKFNKIVKNESNNGVRNIYLKYVKDVEQ